MSAILRRIGQPLLQRRPSSQNTILREQRRGFASEEHGEKKVNFWQAPTNVASWKEEQIVLVVLAAWGLGITTAMKAFGGKKEEAK
ncbi:hypothetical protein COCSUDRAFT_53518 [Coccomyxa subellipsoidea C-169]|uniref:Uncharacterized protein n=1 Tax=Coccomyxa subellipsoidea (strain C-169) TaxID=574566 RepID=I0YXL8_COCSC|nr:hypothetical protein COCSUDRAFT_53518 [Coccomyxa subellipsoidea C-169]EIE23137.1 hypothetical protein COCSUDRAFT_53518 [Coccomyxa subellipsoidea C-169]|eukprot:XP_005647681.1 hypothetical protein COCSUDRAFT_53518 [Coccomyxa subellipsoidea C-169]